MRSVSGRAGTLGRASWLVPRRLVLAAAHVRGGDARRARQNECAQSLTLLRVLLPGRPRSPRQRRVRSASGRVSRCVHHKRTRHGRRSTFSLEGAVPQRRLDGTSRCPRLLGALPTDLLVATAGKQGPISAQQRGSGCCYYLAALPLVFLIALIVIARALFLDARHTLDLFLSQMFMIIAHVIFSRDFSGEIKERPRALRLLQSAQVKRACVCSVHFLLQRTEHAWLANALAGHSAIPQREGVYVETIQRVPLHDQADVALTVASVLTSSFFQFPPPPSHHFSIFAIPVSRGDQFTPEHSFSFMLWVNNAAREFATGMAQSVKCTLAAPRFGSVPRFVDVYVDCVRLVAKTTLLPTQKIFCYSHPLSALFIRVSRIFLDATMDCLCVRLHGRTHGRYVPRRQRR